jgi:phospholipase/carboxylesterase
MHDASLLLARPEISDRLILIYHGVGSSARDLAPVGQAVAQAAKTATVVSVEAPHPSQLGHGKEWFSVVGVTEDNRPQRIAQAMPALLDSIRHWQGVSGIGTERTALLGFSQGAIMSLESTQAVNDAGQAAGMVLALAGRFATPVRHAPSNVRVHLIHGDHDGVVNPRWSVEAEQQLKALGGHVTLDQLPELGHSIDAQALQLVLHYLKQ